MASNFLLPQRNTVHSHARGDSEAMEYAAKAEEAIGDGLRNVRERDGLWIVTSEVEKFFGDAPARVKALARAIEVNPGTVVARYLLGRTYRHSGEADKALSILEPLVKGNPEEFRAFVEYALALVATGRPLAEAVAIMNIATTYGLSDARFVATLGGLQYMTGDFSSSEKTFNESIRREFPYAEAAAIHFRPSSINLAQSLKLQGKIYFVRPNFLVVEAEGYPRIVGYASKVGGTPLRAGMRVHFEVDFSARSAIATKLAVVQ